MKKLLEKYAAALVRHGLTALFGWLLAKGYVTAEQHGLISEAFGPIVQGMTIVIVTLIGPLFWSLSEKLSARFKQLVALTVDPKGWSMEDIDNLAVDVREKLGTVRKGTKP